MATLSFIGKKRRKTDEGEEAYATIYGRGYQALVLKRYAADDAKLYARWYVKQDLGMGYSEGDTYVTDLVSIGALLAGVDGREPTAAEQTEFTALKEALAKTPGGVRIL